MPQALERVLGESCELNDLWDDIDLAESWPPGVEELRTWVGN